MDRSFTERNDRERARLRRLIESLSDAELGRDLGDGWTVAALLAHLAFWDRYALAVLETWQHSGAPPRTGEADAINAAALPTWRALPPRAALEGALAAADAVDARIAALPPPFVAAILATGRLRTLDRSLHRQAHREAIERAIGGA